MLNGAFKLPIILEKTLKVEIIGIRGGEETLDKATKDELEVYGGKTGDEREICTWEVGYWIDSLTH